jgi:hypothetical protein
LKIDDGMQLPPQALCQFVQRLRLREGAGITVQDDISLGGHQKFFHQTRHHFVGDEFAPKHVGMGLLP